MSTDDRPTARRTGPVTTLLAALVVTAGLLASGAPTARAQAPTPVALADSLESGVTAAFMAGDTARLREMATLAERAAAAHPDDPWLPYYRGFALYRLGTLALSQDEDRADRILERAQQVFRRSAERDSLAESFALLASTKGMRISVNPMVRGMTMGSEVGGHLETAMELAPENPRVWLVRGVNALNTPGMFGGGTDEAIRRLQKALSLFSGPSASGPAPSWGEAETYAWLGQAYADQDSVAMARTAYRDALRLEPDFRWVSEQLLPALRDGGDQG